jgi:hypothetical protein
MDLTKKHANTSQHECQPMASKIGDRVVERSAEEVTHLANASAPSDGLNLSGAHGLGLKGETKDSLADCHGSRR